jgi:hypothetical protein
MERLLEFYLEDATVAEGLAPVVYELPWGVAAEPAGYRWDGWAFLQRRDGALPEHFFEKLPPGCQQMPVALHLELSWEGLNSLAEGEGASRGASFATLVRTLLSGGGRWVAAFWAPSDKVVAVADGDAQAVIDAVMAGLQPGGATSGRGWAICRCSPDEAAGEGGPDVG